MESISLDDRGVIERQIGRSARGVAGIPVRCSYGYPQVIRVQPLIDREPFPTLYWLTCPYLAKEIDRLEADGWVGRLERRMNEDPQLGTEMAQAHARYIVERTAMLTDTEHIELESSGMRRSLLEKGIGGIADRRRLKCLHLHVAHHLASGNPIGAIVCAMLPSSECESEEVICSALT